MATLIQFTCKTCKKIKAQAVEVYHPIEECDECLKVKVDFEKISFMTDLRTGKSLEERVVLLEDFIYDQIKKGILKQ